MISRRRLLASVISLAVFAAQPAAGGVFDQFLGFFSDVNVVSVEQEAAFAKEASREVEKKQRIVRDESVAGYVQRLGGRLEQAVGERPFRYRFRVVDDPSVNAFNIGGGYVYVHTGLLAAAGSEGEVASVIAHEMGHQIERHVAKMISRDAMFRTVAGVALGQQAGGLSQLAAGLGITTGQLYFGREAEREADRRMVDVLVRAGYDPREALEMFERLRSLQRGEPGRVASIFSSHPPTSERIDRVRDRIAAMRLPSDLRRDSRDFQAVRRSLRK